MNCSQILTIRETCAFISQCYKPSLYGVLPHWTSFSKWILLLFIFILALRSWATTWGFAGFFPLFSYFFPCIFCFKHKVSYFQKCGNFDYLIFQRFLAPNIPQTSDREDSTTLYFSGFQSYLRVWGRLRGGRSDIQESFKRTLSKMIGWFVVGFLKALLHGSRGANVCLSRHIHGFSEALREHFKCVNSGL